MFASESLIFVSRQDLDNAKELVGQQRQHEQIDDKEDRPATRSVWFMWEVAAFFAMWMDPFCLFRGLVRELLFQVVEQLHRLDGRHGVRLGAAQRVSTSASPMASRLTCSRSSRGGI